MNAFFSYDGLYELLKNAPGTVAHYVESNKDRFEILAGKPIDDLLHSMIAHELMRFARNPENAIHFPDFANSIYLDGSWLYVLLDNAFDENGSPVPSSLLMGIIRAAIDEAAMIESIPQTLEETQENIARLETERDSLPEKQEEFEALQRETNHAFEQVSTGFTRWRAIQAEALDFPVDKMNNRIWNMLEESGPNGQLRLNFNMDKKGSKDPAIVLYGISFESLDPNLKISRQLTPFDKRVYVAVAALYNAGNEYMSATQIHKAMGNKGQPTQADIKKINDSLTKMGMARVYINNADEIKKEKKYPSFQYDAPLLPFERASVFINNTMTEAAIHPYREPPLISFARGRNQITTIKRELLESPISKTDANLMIDDYLIEMISVMKRNAANKKKFSRKLMLETVYRECKITTTKQKQRAPEKIERYLQHYKMQDFIKGYTITADSITIDL